MNYASSNNYFEADVIAEAQGANILAYYTQGQGLISQRRNNASYFYHYDGLGSTKALTDANQNIQSSTIYDAWGNILQSSGTITNPYLYVGELGYYGDGDAGMYLLTQRWYNPTIGRFVVKDILFRRGSALVNPAMASLFCYAENKPSLFVDPQGLFSRDPTDCLSDLQECIRQAEPDFGQCLKDILGPERFSSVLPYLTQLLYCFTACPICGLLSPECVVVCLTIFGFDYKLYQYAADKCHALVREELESCEAAYYFCCNEGPPQGGKWIDWIKIHGPFFILPK
jgi:RHS repeat-associated protein